jgi:hypothetical protein
VRGHRVPVTSDLLTRLLSRKSPLEIIMSISLHRGHAALLKVVGLGETCTATLKNGTVSFDHHSQDFLVGWYDDLKSWELIEVSDFMGKSGKLGETVVLTTAGQEALVKVQQAT